ncbi:MAG: ribonuclease PH [Gemmataceae bacterium]|nr:ribonuclease PH [Gemmataceae bacterium]
MRSDGRNASELRPMSFTRKFTGQAAGSVLVSMGRTSVLCTCSIEEKVPPFLEGKGKGWLSAEYSMLPGSTSSRKARDKGGKVDGRSVEIQRLIGRSLRAIIHLDKIGERTLWIDCDVLEADGGTRTASINGAFVALVDALDHLKSKKLIPGAGAVLQDSVAAISMGIVHGRPLLDLCYKEDAEAEVDSNLVMTGSGEFIEIQGSGEEAVFNEKQLGSLLKLGKQGIKEIIQKQKKALGSNWPLD